MSPTDPTGRGLLYFTKEAAEHHRAEMNKLIETWPEGWNVDFWKNKPEPWKIFALGITEEIL